MALPRRDVEFQAFDGTTLRGWHYPTSEKRPCIIMSHGLAGIRHFRLPNFAQRFQEAGLNVLLYDNRGWGDSDGLPKNESNPAYQHSDYFDAFNYATTLPSVDSDQIVYWGSSFSGATTILAAASDKRIKAAIVQCSGIAGHYFPKSFKDLLPGVLNNRAKNTPSNQSRIPVVAADRESAKTGTAPALFNSLDAYDNYTEIYSTGGKWENWVTEQTLLHMWELDAEAMMHRISPTPFLMVIPSNDTLVTTDSQLTAYGKAKEPKQMVWIEGAGHFDIYKGEFFERNIKAQIEFLRKNLSWKGESKI
ncbi:hypothetical protein CB0940_03556 [Cercospora beticola]|uniref:Serine aminopeptidase S33 domain-containing protein n=1 Tax=Cercospora beticola TaxID=122368 RepID=A0A2G5I3G5_CERBT|nr:hypothetical protein CB0940_03556 [Cercospora beticola]PIA99291.1 hypothetical protein CB0940_03556 [Cercospora beticola]WPB00732.1 hypothetical protein RHO25_005352 [Cercospora beticola]